MCEIVSYKYRSVIFINYLIIYDAITRADTEDYFVIHIGMLILKNINISDMAYSKCFFKFYSNLKCSFYSNLKDFL